MTRSPWHSYLPFPRTPIKAATLSVHVSGRGRRESWERRALSFVRDGKGRLLGREAAAPGQLRRDRRCLLPHLSNCRPLPPTPETRGQSVSVFGASEGPLSREEGTWLPLPSHGCARTPGRRPGGHAQRAARLLQSCSLACISLLRNCPSHQQCYPLKSQGPKAKRQFFSVVLGVLSLFLGLKRMSTAANVTHLSFLFPP